MLITSLVGIISSVKETEIDVVFHDPKGFLKDAVIHYFWFINTVNYGQTPTVSIIALLPILTMLPFFRVTLNTISLFLVIMMWK